LRRAHRLLSCPDLETQKINDGCRFVGWKAKAEPEPTPYNLKRMEAPWGKKPHWALPKDYSTAWMLSYLARGWSPPRVVRSTGLNAPPRELPQATYPNAYRPGPQIPKWVDYHARSTPCWLTLRLPSGPMKNPKNGCGDLSKMPPTSCAHHWS